MVLYKLYKIFQNYLESKSSNIIVTIHLPQNIVYRTELICHYISEEEKCDFDLNTFLLLLYYDFVKECIETYNPKKILQKLTHKYFNDKSLIISNGYENYQLSGMTKSLCTITINFDKQESSKGELILKELEELFHTKILFSTLLEQIWMNFIENYKTGDNKKAFNYLRTILKNSLVD